MRLTKKQRDLVEEVEYLLESVGVSPDVSDVEPEFRTTRLEMAKRTLITSEILTQYLLMDELLSDVICREFFPSRSYPELWRTKRFKDFNFYVIERLYLVQKADYVRARIRLPDRVYKNLMALNGLRNALAHSFFPENVASSRLGRVSMSSISKPMISSVRIWRTLSSSLSRGWAA